MATISSVGGVQYIVDAPAGETIHEHDSEINKDQIKFYIPEYISGLLLHLICTFCVCFNRK